MSDFINDFLQGEKDCQEGIPHEDGKSEAYDSGYSSRYQHEQNMSALDNKEIKW